MGDHMNINYMKWILKIRSTVTVVRCKENCKIESPLELNSLIVYRRDKNVDILYSAHDAYLE